MDESWADFTFSVDRIVVDSLDSMECEVWECKLRKARMPMTMSKVWTRPDSRPNVVLSVLILF